MKATLIVILVLLFRGIAFSQYYPVPATEVDLSALLRSEVRISVKEFTISNLVTVSEFNSYLLAVEKDSTKQFYENQLPKLGKKSMELVAAIRSNPELQDQPMPGVSWTVAKNYCLPKYSFYFPHIRKQLASNTLSIAGHPEVKNLDDYFFFHPYRGRITYFSNWNDSRDSRLVEKNRDVELMHVVAEHGLWLEYGR